MLKPSSSPLLLTPPPLPSPPPPQTILLVTLITSILARLSMLLSDSPYYLCFAVFLTAVLNAPVKPLMDSSVMHMLRDKESYGRMRLWGQLGFGLGSSGVGMLLSRSKVREREKEREIKRERVTG